MLRPVLNRVIARPKYLSNKSKGGIYIPEQVLDREKAGNYEGEVIAIGPTAFMAEDKEMLDNVKVGDKIIWPRYAGFLHPPGEEPEFAIISDVDILAVNEE